MAVGGQAVFGGVLLRDDVRWAVAVRTPDGAIATHEGTLPTWGRSLKPVPFLRGLVAIGQVLPLGARALKWSASHGLTKPARRSTTVARVAGLVAVLLVVPPVTTEWLVGGLESAWVDGIVANLLSVAVLTGYAAAVGRFQMLPTLFEHHGAEHKVVAAHEAGAPLTPTSAAAFSTRHARCGTSLLLSIVIVSFAASMLRLPALLSFVLVAAVATELQLQVAARLDRGWARQLARPGMALQRLTTREPSLAQLEVALAALQVVVTTSAAQPSAVVVPTTLAPAAA